MSSELLRYEVRDQIAWITFNRPESMNALNREMTMAMAEAWEDFRQNDAARVAILSGAGGRAFSAGADLKERAVRGDPYEARWSQGVSGGASALGGPGRRKPTIAAINGYCLAGGFELALTCDIRIATPSAQLGLPQIQRGSYPGGIGLGLLAKTVPMSSVMEILLTGDPIGADEALRLGIVSRIVPEDQLLTSAEALAQRIIRNAPLATEAVKEVLLRALDMPLDQWHRMNTLYRTLIGQTEDAKEGPRAFAEKRPPQYKGR